VLTRSLADGVDNGVISGAKQPSLEHEVGGLLSKLLLSVLVR
jgi:hypothetical protein